MIRRRVPGVLEVPSNRYPAAWITTGESLARGVLVLEEEGFRLEGRRDGNEVAETVAYSTIERIRIGREADERLNARPTLVVERGNAPSMLIEVFGIGLLAEVGDALTALAAGAAESAAEVALVVPLRRGSRAKALELIENGPPFDPHEVGLTGHQVFLTEQDAVFVFSGPGVRALLEQVAGDPGLWRAGLGWTKIVAGRPRIADAVYAWRET